MHLSFIFDPSHIKGMHMIEVSSLTQVRLHGCFAAMSISSCSGWILGDGTQLWIAGSTEFLWKDGGSQVSGWASSANMPSFLFRIKWLTSYSNHTAALQMLAIQVENRSNRLIDPMSLVWGVVFIFVGIIIQVTVWLDNGLPGMAYWVLIH